MSTSNKIGKHSIVATPPTHQKGDYEKTHPFVCIYLLLCPLVLRANPVSDVLVDSFATSQSAPGGVGTRNTAVGGGILGGERDIHTFLTLSANGTVPGQLRVAFPNGLLTGRAGGDITYDGVDGDPSSSFFGGLGSVDLTQGGVNDRFRFDITSIANTSATLLIDVFSVNHGSSIQLNLPQSPGLFDVPFSAFLSHGSPFAFPVDFHNVGYIDFHFEMGAGDAVVMDSIAVVPEPPSLALISLGSFALFAMWRKLMSKRS
jgi:hypothetical protein